MKNGDVCAWMHEKDGILVDYFESDKTVKQICDSAGIKVSKPVLLMTAEELAEKMKEVQW